MAKAPSAGQRAKVQEILQGSRLAARSQPTLADRHAANYAHHAAHTAVTAKMYHQANRNDGYTPAPSGGGDSGGLIGDVVGGIEDAGKGALDTALKAINVTHKYGGGSLLWLGANASNALRNVEGRDAVKGFSYDDVVEKRGGSFGANVAAALGNKDGSITGNKAADFGIGFAGDVMGDPISYVLPAHVSTEEATGAAIEATNAARAAGDVEGVARGEGIVAKLGRTKSVAGLAPEDVQFIGKEGGYTAFGKNIGGQGVRNAIYEHNPLSMARRGIGDVLDKGGLLSRGSVNGATAEYKAALRSGVPQDAWAGAVGLRAERAKNLLTGSVSADLRARGTEALKGLHDNEVLDAFHGLQGDAEAAARVGEDKMAGLRGWYDDALHEYKAATGKDFVPLDDYVNREITDEMHARIGTSQKKTLGAVVADFVKQRKIVPGSELFGETVPEGLTNSQVLTWANEKSTELLGHGMYKTDLPALMDSYAQQVGNAVGVARRNTLLSNAGLLTERASVEVAPNAEKVANAGERVATAEEKQAAAANDLTGAQDQTARAEQAVSARDKAKEALWSLKSDTTTEHVPGEPPYVGPDAEATSASNHAQAVGEALATDPQFKTLPQADREAAVAYQQGHVDAMVPATAENAKAVGARVADVSEREQERVVKLAQKNGLTPEKANSYVDASVSFADAKQWAERARAEEDPLMSHLAAMRAQESMLEGKMHAEGIKLSTARDKFAAAQVPGEKLASLTQGALRVEFNGIEHEMDPKIVKLIADTMELTTPKATNQFLKSYDTLLNWIKAWEITSPRFLSHITIGHAWNNALARIEMGSYRDFFAADRAFSKGGDAWEAFKAKSGDVADAYEQVDQMVRGGSHEFSPVESGTSGHSFKDATLNPLSQDNKAFYAVRKGGNNVQHMMRTSLGMDTILRKGGSIDDAIEKIAQYHFDYGDLSGFEKGFVKRVIPFYTWTRRNMPLQLEMLAKRPSVYAKYNEFTQNAARVSDKDKGAANLPSYFGEQGAFLTPFTDSGSSVYGSSQATPLKELSENPLDWRTYGSMVAPQIKAPLELFAGKQIYKDLPISDQQMALPSIIKPIAPILETMGISKRDKDGNVTVSGKVAYALEQFAPQIAVAQRAPGGAKAKGREVTNMVNYALGLGLMVNTPQAQKSEKYRKKKAKQDAADAAAGKTSSYVIHYKPKF